MIAVESPHLEAVIEIGATGIRLLVAEISPDSTWKVVDRSERFLALGRDVFAVGKITRESLFQCLAILLMYREALEGWSIDDQHVSVVATSAIREARNRDSVLDRIAVKTGFKVRVIDGIEENRLMFLVVHHVLHDATQKIAKANSIVIDVGGGSTEIMMLQKGKVVSVHSFRMGTVIIEQQTRAMQGSEKDLRRYLAEYIRTTGENLNNELRLNLVKQLVAIGSEAKVAARSIGTKVTELFALIARRDFVAFTDHVSALTTEEIVRQFRIGYSEAESLLPGLLAYQLLLEMTSADTVIVPYLSIREGVIISRLGGNDQLVHDEFHTQVLASAVNLGKRYLLDEAHSWYVARVALQLFDVLQTELGLDRHARLILETAGILHDIGRFIRAVDHHIHSQYLISHSDIFGLTKDDINILANVVRYHRSELPGQNHQAYTSLPRTDRTMVLKLSALLRVADAMDRGHSQHIQDFDIELTQDSLFLRARGTHDVTLERLALVEKGDLFEELFGYKIILV